MLFWSSPFHPPSGSLICIDAEATSWAAALSQLVACAVAEVRAVQSQTKAPSDDSVAPKLAFFEAESESASPDTTSVTLIYFLQSCASCWNEREMFQRP